VDIYERNTRLGRGMNLGNALEAPAEGEWGVTLEETDFALIKEAGFNHVRVPTRWSAHAAQTPPYTIDTTFFQRVDWVLEQAQANNLAVVLNMHHYEEFISDPAAHTPRFISMWRQIAERYAKRSNDLYFEPLNEPHDIGSSKWNGVLAQALDTIRLSNPDRPLIVGPVDWYNFRRLNELALPDDDRALIVTFHYYLPFEFTHQGAEWVNGSEPWLGRRWDGTTNETSSLDYDFARAESWGNDHQRPIYLGEFGAYSKADLDSRVRWTDFVARTADTRKMSWAYWEFRAGFGIYDAATKQWNTRLRQALIPQTAAP
jgi:endoglucanase